MKQQREGIFLSRKSRGFFISIKENQHKLATLGGYNTRANAMKGLLALNRMLNGHYDKVANKYEGIIDLTKVKKKPTAQQRHKKAFKKVQQIVKKKGWEGLAKKAAKKKK